MAWLLALGPLVAALLFLPVLDSIGALDALMRLLRKRRHPDSGSES
ncbi:MULTISPECIES: hypothetical protein [unclassified Frankia]|nr:MULTISPECIES: hypothetical protein [unclassified Frankia]